MGTKLDSTYVPEDMVKTFRVTEPGWYVMDDKRRLVDGPFSTRKECDAAIRDVEDLK